MSTFAADLILEVTGVCDMACIGCYAANKFERPDVDLFRLYPDLFMTEAGLASALALLGDSKINTVAIRGGEPSRHPELKNLLKLLPERFSNVFIETHGKWLLPNRIAHFKELIAAITSKKIIVKISFDSMHGTTSDELHQMTDFLSWNGISHRIAITEKNMEQFKASRAKCSWVKDEHIFFQKKGVGIDELILPRVGVVSINGAIKRTVSTKNSFLTTQMAEQVQF